MPDCHQHSKPVFIVEDEEEIISILKLRLEFEHYELVAYQPGDNVLDRLVHLQPCAVILDLILPDVDGLELLANIKQDEALGNTPVFICSAQYEQESIDKAKELGVTHYFIKPFDVSELIDHLNEVS